jgi:hypothetical protein
MVESTPGAGRRLATPVQAGRPSQTRDEETMKHLFTVLAVAAAGFAVNAQAADAAASAAAPTAQQSKMGTCNKDAGEKKGDERKAFMKSCLSAKKDGRTEQQNKMKTCNADAGTKALKGDERKAFMKSCLSS